MQLWWVDLDWLPDTHQPALPSSQQGEGRKEEKNLVGRDKGRLLSNYNHGQKRLNLKTDWIYYKKKKKCSMVRNKDKAKTTFTLPAPCSQAQLHSFTPDLSTCSLQHREMRNGSCGLSVTLFLYLSFLLTLFPCSSRCPSLEHLLLLLLLWPVCLQGSFTFFLTPLTAVA